MIHITQYFKSTLFQYSHVEACAAWGLHMFAHVVSFSVLGYWNPYPPLGEGLRCKLATHGGKPSHGMFEGGLALAMNTSWAAAFASLRIFFCSAWLSLSCACWPGGALAPALPFEATKSRVICFASLKLSRTPSSDMALALVSWL